jgi:hypothetical protein
MEDEKLFLIVQIFQQSKIIISIIIKKNRQLRFEALQNNIRMISADWNLQTVRIDWLPDLLSG